MSRQAYAGYGEKLLADGTYIPLKGYTGHIQADPTDSIYMRGQFYSPAWHVFMNSDQGVDPNSWNQHAYVGGSPFMATDPSGRKICTETTRTYIDAHGNTGIEGVLECWDGGVAGGGGSSGSGDPWEWGGGGDPVEPLSPATPKPQSPKKNPCPPEYKVVVQAYRQVFSNSNAKTQEWGGFIYSLNNKINFTSPTTDDAKTSWNPWIREGSVPNGAKILAFYHNHPNDIPGGYNGALGFSVDGDLQQSYPGGYVTTSNYFNQQMIMGFTGQYGIKDFIQFWIPKECF